jgi:ornithine decarboxylase
MEDAFYVLDLGLLVRLFQGWVQSMPRVRPFYAVKCSPDRALLTTLAALGAGFDCASKAEISQVLDLGVATDRIVFANPCKMQSHVAYAASVGVNLTTFDSESEVPSSPVPLLPSQAAFSAGCYHSGMFVKPE